MIIKNLIKKSNKIRLGLFNKFYSLQEGHPGSAFSILDFLITIYYNNFVRLKINKSKKQIYDDVIMSKGHATVAQYPILYDLGVISKKDWILTEIQRSKAQKWHFPPLKAQRYFIEKS